MGYRMARSMPGESARDLQSLVPMGMHPINLTASTRFAGRRLFGLIPRRAARGWKPSIADSAMPSRCSKPLWKTLKSEKEGRLSQGLIQQSCIRGLPNSPPVSGRTDINATPFRQRPRPLRPGFATKTCVHQGSITSLVGSVFSASDPTPDTPRLRFDGFDPVGSDGWKSAHDGAAAFGRGCFLRIRNLYTHHEGDTDQEDLEALAALSLLARWIDGAEVVKAESEST
jgi:Protein of unknown function (Hypoth_ymh)